METQQTVERIGWQVQKNDREGRDINIYYKGGLAATLMREVAMIIIGRKTPRESLYDLLDAPGMEGQDVLVRREETQDE